MIGVSGVKGMYGEYGVAGTTTPPPAERSGWAWAAGRSRTVALMVERGRSRSEEEAVRVRRGRWWWVRVRRGRWWWGWRVDDDGGVVVGVVRVGPRAAWVRSGRARAAGWRRV